MSEYSFAYPRIGRRTCANRCVFLCGLHADFRELAANLCGQSEDFRELAADLRNFANSRTRRELVANSSRTFANSRISIRELAYICRELAANHRELAANHRESAEGFCVSSPTCGCAVCNSRTPKHFEHVHPSAMPRCHHEAHLPPTRPYLASA